MNNGYRENYRSVNSNCDVAGYREFYSVLTVTVGERIAERLKLLNISQSELARRTGLAQPTINALIKRNKVGSKYLHRVAAELLTSAAYLTGETENPEPGYEVATVLSSEEREILDVLRSMSARDRSAFMQVVRLMSGGIANAALGVAKCDHGAEA
jgi:transcriptional regulator with XRE-family HTH domain